MVGRITYPVILASIVLALTYPPLVLAAPSFAGKTVQMIIGFNVGGGYDLWGRLVGRHIGKHLPGNPNVVPQNMPGGGSFVAANYLYNVAPKDGSTFGIIARDAYMGPLTGVKGARFNPTKMSWLGTPTTEVNVCVAVSSASAKSMKDLYTKQLIVGDVGAGDGTHTFPTALNSLLGMKFKIVGGYKSSGDIFLAMERGEIEGICQSLSSVMEIRPTWISEGKLNVLFQGGAEPDPSLKNVPFILNSGKNDEQSQELQFLYEGQGVGRPFVAPPGLSDETFKMLREAFDATMIDPEFLADAKKMKFDIAPRSGEYLQTLIYKLYATPTTIVKKVGEAMK